LKRFYTIGEWNEEVLPAIRSGRLSLVTDLLPEPKFLPGAKFTALIAKEDKSLWKCVGRIYSSHPDRVECELYLKSSIETEEVESEEDE